jgi:hypothetical protein
LSLPHCSLGTTNDSDIPVRPARAVRPTRWVYDLDVVGRSKLSTQATSTKSTPRVTPYSLSLFCLRFLDFLEVGAGEEARLRFLALLVEASPSKSEASASGGASRCVDVTEGNG